MLLVGLPLGCSAPGRPAGGPPAIAPAPLPAAAVDVRPPGGFEMILWLHGGPPRDRQFFTAIKELGCTAVSVSSGEDPTVPGRYGLRFYSDQILGKGILELRDRQFDPVRKAYELSRDPKDLVRPACLSSMATLATLSGILSDRLRLALPNHPLAVSLGDEISVTRHANPLDLCFDKRSLKEFRAFLARRYVAIDRLNQSWNTRFQSFDEVLPFTADQIRARELDGPVLAENLRPWAEHREFMDGELAAVVTHLVEQVRRHDPQLPCGLTGMPAPAAYGGHDYARLLPGLRFYEVYDVGGARDLAMSLAPAGARQVATLFPPKPGEGADLVRARLADMLAHGLWGAVVWSAGEVLDAGCRPTAYGRALAAALDDLKPALAAFAGATVLRSPVWILESQASVRAWWMLDSRADGDTWIRRLSSYEVAHSTSIAARHSWVRILEDLGMQPRLVPETELAERLRKAPPRLLVLPATLALSEANGRAIATFVNDGGFLVADHSTALYDESLGRRGQGLLDGLFGIQKRSLLYADQLVAQGVPDTAGRLSTGAAAAERGLEGGLAEKSGDLQVQVERRVGKGRAVYLNLAVCEYGRVRLDKEPLETALDLRQRVLWVLREAGVATPVSVVSERVPTCLERIVLQAEDGRTLLAVRVNALEAPAVLQEVGKGGSRPIKLTFPDRRKITDLITGKTYAAATEHNLRLDPFRGLFLVVSAGR
jgi:Beta-galactosidase